MPYVANDPATRRQARVIRLAGVLAGAVVVLMVIGLVFSAATVHKHPATQVGGKTHASAHASIVAAETVAESVARAVATGGHVVRSEVTPGLYAALTSTAAAPPIPTTAVSATTTEVTRSATVALFSVSVTTAPAQGAGGPPAIHGGATSVVVVHVVVSLAHSVPVVTALPGLVN